MPKLIISNRVDVNECKTHCYRYYKWRSEFDVQFYPLSMCETCRRMRDMYYKPSKIDMTKYLSVNTYGLKINHPFQILLYCIVIYCFRYGYYSEIMSDFVLPTQLPQAS